MLSYLIVGSGYRSEYYGRIAAKYPGLFRALFLCRSAEKAELVTAHTGIPATTGLNEALAFSPDFIVVAVDRASIAEVTEEWVLRGFPVVAETPVGSSVEKLERIWDLKTSKNAKIVCCEQYYRHPVLSAGLSAVADGLIGRPVSGYLSLVHDYHAASILRKMLLTDGEGYTLRGERTVSPVVDTDSRYGAFYDGHTCEEVRDTARITYDSGKTAIYDFAPTQYRTYIRSRHLTVRGERGEWSDRMLYYLDVHNIPQKQLLAPSIPEKYRTLDTQALRDIRRTWQPELQTDTEQDEYAIATMLLDMENYIAGGPSPYPLEEALDDALFWLLVQDAVSSPGHEFRSPRMPWHTR
ncbi:MAG: Gfo/Idh/MocA family oxidoreductase [Lachnospiraceae bacterium]|nr:Gfo/Idh/MocA family oxidoreductase [Lachnospiraceae bacterium]